LNKAILAFAEEGINAALYWENADIDDMTKKIASKDIVPATASGKVLRLDEEDVDNDDLDTTISSKAKSTKELVKTKNVTKQSK